MNLHKIYLYLYTSHKKVSLKFLKMRNEFIHVSKWRLLSVFYSSILKLMMIAVFCFLAQSLCYIFARSLISSFLFDWTNGRFVCTRNENPLHLGRIGKLNFRVWNGVAANRNIFIIKSLSGTEILHSARNSKRRAIFFLENKV